MTLYSSNSWENYWMSFLQLVLSLDKTKDGINSILENMSSWHLPILQHLPFFEEWMFVEMFVIAQLVLGGVFCGNQSNCRVCILIGECWNGVDSLEILEHCRICRIAWKGWKVMNDWNVWNVWNDWNVWKDWKDWNVWNVL